MPIYGYCLIFLHGNITVAGWWMKYIFNHVLMCIQGLCSRGILTYKEHRAIINLPLMQHKTIPFSLCRIKRKDKSSQNVQKIMKASKMYYVCI